jgi:hypothetical protein
MGLQMSDWNVLLMRWVIEDGYSEVHKNQVLTWIVEFQCETPLRLSTEKDKRALTLEENRYRINAEVVYISQDPKQMCCILDCGITVVSESGALLGMPLPPGCREGDYVVGDVWLQFPLCTDVQPYNIRHRWHVNQITAKSLPSSSHSDMTSRTDDVQITDTGFLKAEAYILNCSHLSSPVGNRGKPPINQDALKYLVDEGHVS